MTIHLQHRLLRHRRQPAARRQQGFTLVELMVALVIALILLVGLGSLFVSNIRSRTELDKYSRQLENGRYALYTMSSDFASAGYYGSMSTDTFEGQIPTLCPTEATQLGYQLPANTEDKAKLPLPVYVPDAAPTCVTNAKAGSPIVLLTRVSSNAVAPADATANETYVQASNCESDNQSFAIGVAADGGNSATFPLLQKGCEAGKLAAVRKVVHRLYYVSTCHDCTDGKADDIPTLKVVDYAGKNTATVTAVAEGIEELRVDYGIDMDANGSPDCYVSNPNSPPTAEIAEAVCPKTTPEYVWTDGLKNWQNVVTLRLHVLARTIDPTAGWSDNKTYEMGLDGTQGPFNDTYKRHAYITTVRLNNVAGHREGAAP
ncbi:MAG: PilW family protein [Brachymonas sp.]|nr:PilW family protein [Brachymonas sp.]